MADHEPTDEPDRRSSPMDLERKVDVIAGAVADLQGRMAEMSDGLEPIHASLAALAASASSQRDELLLALDVLTRVAEAVERLDDRTEDRLAAVRDAAMTPAADLQAMLAARSERIDARLDELAAVVQGMPTRGDGEEPSNLSARVDELARAVESLTWQLPELVQEVSALREQQPSTDLVGPVAGDVDDLAVRLADHTDVALAGMLRLLDQRLDAVRDAVTQSAAPQSQGMGGFEAGAVMGAAQAAWNRLEQRLDNEFDDLSRQLQTMGTLIEQATASAEAAANRPVVTGDQLRSAASAVKDSVLKARRNRRGRGEPPPLGPGAPRT